MDQNLLSAASSMMMIAMMTGRDADFVRLKMEVSDAARPVKGVSQHSRLRCPAVGRCRLRAHPRWSPESLSLALPLPLPPDRRGLRSG